MKISRNARDKYKFESNLFSERGNIDFEGNVHAVRVFVEKVNQKRDLLNYPELAVKSSDIYGLSLMTEINEYIYDMYLEELQSPTFNQELYDFLEKKVGKSRLQESTRLLIEEFPPESVYKNTMGSKEFLEAQDSDVKNEVLILDEFVTLWLSNANPAFSPYYEFFDDENLEKSADYVTIIESIHEFMETKPIFSRTGKNIITTLQEPAIKHPHSLKNQLEYIQENWSEFLGKWAYLLLTGLDLIKEEEKMRFQGPGETQVPDFYGLDSENYSPDSVWMPKVVMIAKNSYVWLDQLSKKYKQPINHLDQIPDEELDQLANWGFTALWLIGLWERSPASKTIKNWCGNPEAEASAYSLYDYVIATDLGGENAYLTLKQKAMQRGIRLASDMVPNHTGIDSKWIREHPDWYVSLPYPPFPSYQYSGHSLSNDSSMGIYIEDKYFTRQDAAVTFKHVDLQNGTVRYIYHGNDGTSMPWNDTAQLNYLLPEVREAVIQTIIHVAKLSPIIRFDAAMTLTRLHFQRLWFPEPGSGGDIPSRAGLGLTKEEFLKLIPEEFWREVVDRVKEEVPGTLLLAEAFWLLEGFFVRTLGMHRVYNSIFMNALRDEDNALYRTSVKKTLEFDRRMLKRFVNFMNNPDEETAANQFGDGDKYFGICLMLVTMPGLPMIGHGQVEGYREKYGMEFRRAYRDENINQGLLQHHERTIFQIMKKRYVFANSDNFYLYDFWSGSNVNEDVFVYSNFVGNERALVIYNNQYNSTSGTITSSVGYNEGGEIKQKNIVESLDIPIEGYSIVKDYMSGLEFLWLNRAIHEHGHYFDLHGYHALCFLDWRIQPDNEESHYAQLYKYLGGKGVPSIQDSLKELIYQPILEPFRQIMSSEFISRCYLTYSGISSDSSQLGSTFAQAFQLFLGEIKIYLSIQSDTTLMQTEVLSLFNNLIGLRKEIDSIPLDEITKTYLLSVIPQTEIEWTTLYSWVAVHKLGNIQLEENYNSLSRSWIEEWRLGNVIEWVLGEIQQSPSNGGDTLFVIKLMTEFQNWFNNPPIEDSPLQYTLLKRLLREPEIQNYLGVNRFQDILYFNAERFESLCKWLLNIVVLQLLGNGNHTKINEAVKIIDDWLRISNEVNYQITSLLEKLRE
ncbi:MAG: alpha-amylase family glycosyl hydrolase [Promethearchaeota archaeon]